MEGRSSGVESSSLNSRRVGLRLSRGSNGNVRPHLARGSEATPDWRGACALQANADMMPATAFGTPQWRSQGGCSGGLSTPFVKSTKFKVR